MKTNLQAVLDKALADFAPGLPVTYLPPTIAGSHEAKTYWEPGKAVSLEIPKPTTLSCLFIALHEVGHVATKVWELPPWLPPEACASYWARDYMVKQKLRVPSKIWKTAMEIAARADPHGGNVSDGSEFSPLSILSLLRSN